MLWRCRRERMEESLAISLTKPKCRCCRLILGLLALATLRDLRGGVAFPLLYDAPHNLV